MYQVKFSAFSGSQIVTASASWTQLLTRHDNVVKWKFAVKLGLLPTLLHRSLSEPGTLWPYTSSKAQWKESIYGTTMTTTTLSSCIICNTCSNHYILLFLTMSQLFWTWGLYLNVDVYVTTVLSSSLKIHGNSAGSLLANADLLSTLISKPSASGWIGCDVRSSCKDVAWQKSDSGLFERTIAQTRLHYTILSPLPFNVCVSSPPPTAAQSLYCRVWLKCNIGRLVA